MLLGGYDKKSNVFKPNFTLNSFSFYLTKILKETHFIEIVSQTVHCLDTIFNQKMQPKQEYCLM